MEDPCSQFQPCRPPRSSWTGRSAGLRKRRARVRIGFDGGAGRGAAQSRTSAKATGKGQNRLERARRASVAKIQTVGDTIGTTLKKYVEAVPSLERLPEFQRELGDLVVGVRRA